MLVKIFIRNMVCVRCQMVVKAELEKLGICYTEVKIGEVNAVEEVPRDKLDQLDIALKKAGLLLIDNKKSILVEKITAAVIELVHYTEEQIKYTWKRTGHINPGSLYQFNKGKQSVKNDYHSDQKWI